MRVDAMKLATVVVFGIALSALALNHTALVGQGRGSSPLKPVLGARRVSAADASFRYSASLVIDPIKDKIQGHKIDMDMYGSFVWSDTIWNTTSGDNSLFTKTIFWFAPDFKGRVQEMTASQLAVAETLFKEVDLKGAKNLSIGQTGISGSVTARELGLKTGQIERMTRARLNANVRSSQAALAGLGR